MANSEDFEIQTATSGRIAAEAVEYAVDQVRSVARYTAEPVLFARVRLTRLPNPAIPRPVVAQCNLDVNGRLVRSQAAGPSSYDAVHGMVDRLRTRLERTSRTWESVRDRAAATTSEEWRPLSRPSDHPPYVPLPREEREVVRRKSYTLPRQSVDEAIFDMTMLDYDFHLFTDAAADQDSVVYRSGDGYRLAQVSPRPDRLGPTAAEVTVSRHGAPTLTVPEAIERLEIITLPFVFFTDAVTGRGNVLYQRYDGHYGLITPAQ